MGIALLSAFSHLQGVDQTFAPYGWSAYPSSKKSMPRVLKQNHNSLLLYMFSVSPTAPGLQPFPLFYRHPLCMSSLTSLPLFRASFLLGNRLPGIFPTWPWLMRVFLLPSKGDTSKSLEELASQFLVRQSESLLA